VTSPEAPSVAPAPVAVATTDAAAADRAAARRASSQRRHHRDMLILSVLCLVLAFALEVTDGGERVCVRGIPAARLPGTCLSREWFRLECPGCGLTRSMVLFARGQWLASWRMHHLGWLFFVMVAAQLPYRWLSLRRARTVLGPRTLKVISITMIVLLIGNWVVGMLVG
jgi:hypothetical protein